MSTNFSPDIELQREFQQLRPNFSEVARELNVTPQHVRRVYWGLSTSSRVMKALTLRMRQKARKQGKGKAVAA